jgi:hypothetical protein
MIGVAMYELVWTSFAIYWHKANISRFELVTITSSAKLFESKRTELLFKYTKRQVWDISGVAGG